MPMSDAVRQERVVTWLQKAKEAHGDRYTYTGVTFEAKARIHYVCQEHGEVSQNAEAHARGQGCAKCAYIAKGSKRQQGLASFVAKAKGVHGDRYTYESVDYTGRPKLTVICPEHGRFTLDAQAHIAGQGCAPCGRRKQVESQTRDLAEFIGAARAVHGERYEYLALKRDSTSAKAVIVCPDHGEFEQYLANHLQGRGCRTCKAEATKKLFTVSDEEFFSRARKVHGERYTYFSVTRPESGKTSFSLACPEHGEYEQTTNDHLNGSGCPACVGRVSKPNLEIQAFITSLGQVSELEYPIGGKSLDIVVLDKKLAIEYNGNYWHSTEYRLPNTHATKTKLAREKGFRLLHIHSHEWRDKREVCERIIAAALGVVKERVFARKLQVRPVDRATGDAFLGRYHIQGKPRQGDYIGLYSDKLVAVMSFSYNTSNRRQAAEVDLVELNRYATSCSVVGGFSKLLQAWLRLNRSVVQVVSYSDERLYTGEVYAKAGFVKKHTTAPDYMYLERSNVPDNLHHKSKYQKSKLQQRFGKEFCHGKTEKEITEAAGIYRVYDCGKTKWVYYVCQNTEGVTPQASKTWENRPL